MSKYFHVRYKPKPERTLEQMPTAELAAGINHILDTLRARGVVVRDYDDKDVWLKKAVLNTASSAMFTSDRTISEYNDKIWHLKPLQL